MGDLSSVRSIVDGFWGIGERMISGNLARRGPSSHLLSENARVCGQGRSPKLDHRPDQCAARFEFRIRVLATLRREIESASNSLRIDRRIAFVILSYKLEETHCCHLPAVARYPT